MKSILGILWAIGPVALYNFPAELISNGLPKWPVPEEFVPKKEGGWNHYSKNALAAVVRTDWGFWGQFLAFLGWIGTIATWVF